MSVRGKHWMPSAFREDLGRYSPREWIAEPSLLAIATYRFGQWVDRVPGGRTLLPLYLFIHYFVALLTGISIPKRVQIGGGLRIFHFGGVIVHPAVVIGRGVTIGHGVTLGVRESEHEAPVIGDDVVLGAYAQILGGVKVGDGAKVGAMAVVLRDVAPGQSVVGNPARPTRPATPET